MNARDAAELIELFEHHGLEVYVDGGWAVDALLGEQTRPHRDLDIAIPEKYVPLLRELLAARGYREQPRDDSWECNFVLADAHGREIDVHSYSLDDAGNNVQGVAYTGEQLTGTGCINGYPVRCISPEWLVKFHTGYELDENDFSDVRALCERFSIPLPDEYLRFTRSEAKRFRSPSV
jgi:lincosamide nucleotidyltransferase A/C/D/E